MKLPAAETDYWYNHVHLSNNDSQNPFPANTKRPNLEIFSLSAISFPSLCSVHRTSASNVKWGWNMWNLAGAVTFRVHLWNVLILCFDRIVDLFRVFTTKYARLWFMINLTCLNLIRNVLWIELIQYLMLAGPSQLQFVVTSAVTAGSVVQHTCVVSEAGQIDQHSTGQMVAQVENESTGHSI
jgi:hypothetical protein